VDNFKIGSYLSDKAAGKSEAVNADIYGEELNIERLMIEVSRDFSKRIDFFPDCVETAVDSKGVPFLDYFTRRNVSNRASKNGINCSLTAMIGRVGIGKSAFLRWWKESYAQHSCFILDIETIRTAYSLSIDSIGKFIIDYLCSSIRDRYRSLPDDERELMRSVFVNIVDSPEYEVIKDADSDFLDGALAPEGRLSLLGALITTLNMYLDKPLWVIIDNVDLENLEIRKSIILKMNRIFAKLVHLMDRVGWEAQFHFLITLRPETYHEIEGKSSAANVISYPCGDVQALFLRKIKQSIVEVLGRYRDF